jgi:DNA helicase HerA-like ATPase
MVGFLEKAIARIWNGTISRKRRKRPDRTDSRLDFGFLIKDGQVTKHHFGLNQGRRSEHIAILGKTGSGKSRFLLHLASQDISSDHGFVFFDHHGDATPFLLQLLAAR